MLIKANDGRTFDTVEECETYEKALKEKEKKRLSREELVKRIQGILDDGFTLNDICKVLLTRHMNHIGQKWFIEEMIEACSMYRGRSFKNMIHDMFESKARDEIRRVIDKIMKGVKE